MKKIAWLGVVLGMVATNTFAQELLEDLTRVNARKLNSEEIRSLVVGATSTGPGLKNSFSHTKLHPDGTVSGYILAGGRNFAITNGTYKVTDDAKVCLHYEFNGGIPSYDGCITYYEKDAQYFIAFSDTDPNAQVRKREFKR